MGDVGKVIRAGFIIYWWKADHEPLHVHVRDDSGRKLGRINLATFRSLEGWIPSRKLVAVVREIKRERNL